MSAPSPAEIGERMAGIRARIAGAGGDPEAVRVVAVTKQLRPEFAMAAVAAGVRDIGENYAQELLAKHAVIADPEVRWHFVGAVQRNKVAKLAPLVARWHGVDRLEAGEAIAKRASHTRVMVEINSSGIEGRPGVARAAAGPLVDALLSAGVAVDGLMTVAPLGDVGDARRCFREVAALARGLGLRELSMGMSGDFEVAVAEGSTMVRIGTALFGPRPDRKEVRR